MPKTTAAAASASSFSGPIRNDSGPPDESACMVTHFVVDAFRRGDLPRLESYITLPGRSPGHAWGAEPAAGAHPQRGRGGEGHADDQGQIGVGISPGIGIADEGRRQGAHE